MDLRRASMSSLPRKAESDQLRVESIESFFWTREAGIKEIFQVVNILNRAGG